MWWSWVGYAWLTSVVDPEEGAVRFAIFAAMAAFLVVALCIPEAFGDSRMLFAVAYSVVRFGADRAVRAREPRRAGAARLGARASPAAPRSAAALLIVGALFENDTIQAAIWSVALLLDMLEPYLFGSEGWQLHPSHFAERHGLIIIIALGESIVAIGVGAHGHVDAGVVDGGRARASRSRARSGGSTSTSWRWWPSGGSATPRSGREQNEIARDSFSYLHFPMVAGIVLLALGHEEDARARRRAAQAGPGGRGARRHRRLPARPRRLPLAQRAPLQLRSACSAPSLLCALIPRGDRGRRAGHARARCAVLLAALIAYETTHFADLRERLRHQLESDQGASA